MYEQHYGLTERPFQLTPDPRFWFESATHKKAMAYLGYGLAQGEGFIVVTGEVGSGKTTLVGHLLDTLDPARVCAIRLVSTQLDGGELLASVSVALGMSTPNNGKAQLLDAIEGNLLERARSGQKVLLVVDEVQNLSHSALEELRMLSNFQAGEHAMLQLLLLGQPEFRNRLDHVPELEQLRQRVIAKHHLTAMEPSEIRPYIEYRMGLAGWKGVPGLSDEAVQAIASWSGGIPRKVNTIMSRVLLLGALDDVSVIDGALLSRVLADIASDSPDAPGSVALSPNVTDAHALDLAARLALLETRVAEHETALRRVLEIMVGWAEARPADEKSEFYRAPVA